jgi:hypothetical protein
MVSSFPGNRRWRAAVRGSTGRVRESPKRFHHAIDRSVRTSAESGNAAAADQHQGIADTFGRLSPCQDSGVIAWSLLIQSGLRNSILETDTDRGGRDARGTDDPNRAIIPLRCGGCRIRRVCTSHYYSSDELMVLGPADLRGLARVYRKPS